MKTEEKLLYLTEKLAAKEKALADCSGKKASIKQLEKRLKAEVAALKEEVRAARLEELGDFLQQSGVAFEDIREAVNSGLFDKPDKPEAENAENVMSAAQNAREVNNESDTETVGVTEDEGVTGDTNAVSDTENEEAV